MDFLKKFGIEIKNKELLLQALTHSSYSNEHNVKNYERLEFLGDAVLQILMSDYLYNNMDLSEGDMSKTRASYVCESACCKYAELLEYKPYIRVGHGQLNNINDTIVADIFESIMGCIYLDQGLEVARSLFDQVVIPCVKNHSVFLGDYKSRLQELVQTTKKSLEYRLIGEKGPAHDKEFTVEVVIDDIVYGRGVGKSKKEAEQKAALDAYNKQARL
ncbi:MAG TPA: ribonuclease III [Candidatus Coprovivens excrementavium]|nr:ribonuclease III [Candidatus Coprovivens excrementavium]